METKTFADLGLSPKVQAAITAAGYTIPTPIQAAAIPVAVAGRDVLGIAQTGTGKTASFVLPMISRLETGRARARMPRSLIMAPTRELATQVAQSFEKYGINHKLDVALLIGGTDMDKQIQKLDRGVDVLVATPGRLLDHFGRGRIMLMGVEILVIDEADRMLDMGFIPDIEKICKLLPAKRQTLFFSATMPPEITRLVSQFLRDPLRVEVAKPATTAKTITQRFRYCPDGEDYAKREVLRELIKTGNVKNAIIFCNRKRDVAVLHKSLAKHGFNAGALHGDMEQSARTQTLDKFRAGEIMLLAASDVAARGLDIPDVSHVFNFDLPWAPDDYVHRIGRTGRAGKEGYAASLVSAGDLKSLKDIEKMLGEPVEWLGDPPSEEDYASGGKRRRGGRFGKSAPGGGDSRSGGRAPAGRVGTRPEGHSDRAPHEGRAPRPERAPDRTPERSLERTPERSQERAKERIWAQPPRSGDDQPSIETSPAAQSAALGAEPRAPSPRAQREPREQREPRAAREQRESRAPRVAKETPQPTDPRTSETPRNEQRPRRPEREKRPDSWADAPAKPEKREPRKDQPRAVEPKPHQQQQPGGRVAIAGHAPTSSQSNVAGTTTTLGKRANCTRAGPI